jgi:hypothetical protein
MLILVATSQFLCQLIQQLWAFLTLLLLLCQAGLLKDAPSRQFLEQQAKEVLLKNIETLYACGGRILDKKMPTLSKLNNRIARIFCELI